MPQAPSTRWCPTPEQLMILEEMYRSGIRTPNATQIQQITAHLSYYGKIEGKNVFYWFQNHKARDRQKMRRRLSRHQQLLHQHQINGQVPHPQIFQSTVDLSHPPFHPHHHFPYNHQPQFLHHQETSQVMNLVCKLESTCGKESEMELVRTSSSSNIIGSEWMTMLEMGSSATTPPSPSPPPPCWRQLKTLDLFPTNTTGLKEEYNNTSKSSSCSTSTTN